MKRHTSARPASPHALALTRLSGFLDRYFGGGGDDPAGWWIITEPELHPGRDVLVPDIAGWRRERMPAYPTAPAFEISADWICEILSPSTLRLDRVHKLPRYAHHQVRYAWLVDPVQHMLEVYRLENGHW